MGRGEAGTRQLWIHMRRCCRLKDAHFCLYCTQIKLAASFVFNWFPRTFMQVQRWAEATIKCSKNEKDPENCWDSGVRVSSVANHLATMCVSLVHLTDDACDSPKWYEQDSRQVAFSKRSSEEPLFSDPGMTLVSYFLLQLQLSCVMRHQHS